MQELGSHIVQAFKAMIYVEIAAVISSFICVYLTVRNNVWNWLFGFIGVLLYGYLFWQWRNYANCGLNLLYYVPIQFWGWYVWTRGNTTHEGKAVPITRLTGQGWAQVLITTALLTALFWGLFRFWMPALFPALPTDPLPFADGLTTAISVVAQYLQVKKRFENWLLWIVADVVYTAYVFPVQKLYLSTLLYAVFTVLAIIGARDWLRLLRQQEQEAAKANAPETSASGAQTRH